MGRTTPIGGRGESTGLSGVTGGRSTFRGSAAGGGGSCLFGSGRSIRLGRSSPRCGARSSCPNRSDGTNRSAKSLIDISVSEGVYGIRSDRR